MKKVIFKLFVITLFVISQIYTNAQTLDFLVKFEEEDEVYFDYKYEEFNNYAYLDSTIILESFNGAQNFHKDSIDYNISKTTYYFTVQKVGNKIRRNFHDTISVENIDINYPLVIQEFIGVDTLGAKNQITGWIFLDTLMTSVIDSLDSIAMYPYNRLYRNYYSESDDSLFYKNDTLFIHYRPTTTNYYDSYFSIDYYIVKNRGLKYYRRYYWYYGTGFRESYNLTGFALIDNVYQTNNKILDSFFLEQNFPNPFNPITNIKYNISKNAFVRVIIYDVLGNIVQNIIDEYQKSGVYTVQFDGSKLSSGVYYCRLFVGKNSITKKLILLK